MTGMMCAEQELGGAQLGDARLSRRLVKLATRLAESPSASIPQACRGWAEMRAAYRFLAQDKLDWQDILQPHWDAALECMPTNDTAGDPPRLAGFSLRLSTGRVPRAQRPSFPGSRAHSIDYGTTKEGMCFQVFTLI